MHDEISHNWCNIESRCASRSVSPSDPAITRPARLIHHTHTHTRARVHTEELLRSLGGDNFSPCISLRGNSRGALDTPCICMHARADAGWVFMESARRGMSVAAGHHRSVISPAARSDSRYPCRVRAVFPGNEQLTRSASCTGLTSTLLPFGRARCSTEWTHSTRYTLRSELWELIINPLSYWI